MMADSVHSAKIQPMDIFVSYSRRDSAFVDRLVVDLASHGYRPWCDRSVIRGGQLWQQQIVQGIESCHVFLLVLSAHSVRSINVVKELSLAEANGKWILPVMIESVDIPDTMEYQLAGIQMILVSGSEYDQTLPRLLDGLQADRPAEAASSSAPAPSSPLGHHSQPGGGAADRQRLIDALLPIYGPVIKVIVERSDEPLEGEALQRLSSILLQAGVSEARLQTALEASLPPTIQRPDPQEIRQKLALEFGPIATLIVTPEWLDDWWQDQRQAEEKLARRGIPEQVLVRLRALLNN
jgi:hypothetical protein